MKPDWIIHYILADRPSSHTHGLDRRGSLELELNLPVPQEKAQMILNLLGLEITEKGKWLAVWRQGGRHIHTPGLFLRDNAGGAGLLLFPGDSCSGL